jgi:hypothetical protein
MNTQEAQVIVYHHLIDKYWNGTTPDCRAHLSALNFLTSLAISDADEILKKQNKDYKNFTQTTINYDSPF